MSTDLTIKIPAGSSEARVTLTDKDGLKNHKTVMVDNLISTLTSSFKFSTGLLPVNTRFFSGTVSDYLIGIESPARVRRFLKSTYFTQNNLPKELKIPFPSCLFVFDVRGGKINKTKVFALKGPIARESDTVCRFPFGNTYHDGKVCWGRNTMPAISNLTSLTQVVATFYDAPFNGDLFDAATIKKPHDVSNHFTFWDMLKYLNGKELFPQEMLYDLRVSISKYMRDPNA